MYHFFESVNYRRQWPAVGGLLALLIALSGSASQRIDDKVANNGHDIRDLRSQVAPLEGSVKRRGDDRHSGELESRIDQLVRSADKDSQQLQGLKPSLMILSSELHGQGQRALLATLDATRVLNLETRVETLETRVTTLEKPSPAVQKDDPKNIQLLQEISATTSSIEGRLAKALPAPDGGGQYRRSDLIAGEVMYDTYLWVTELLVVFLGVCLLWGIGKVTSSMLRGIWKVCSSMLKRIQKSGKEFRKWYAARRFPIAMLCLSALFFLCGVACAASPMPVLTAPGAGLPTEVQQQLTNALWQAPLTILTIVLAIGGFFGWQAYKELSDRLYRTVSEKVISEAQTLGGFSLVLGQITTALGIWRLAVELAVEKSQGGPPKSLADSEKAEKELDKKLQRTDEYPETAGSHIRAAKYILFQAVGHLARLPDDVDLPVTYLLRSSVVRMEAKQAYAYQIATDYFSTPSEWEDALRYSREALTFSQDQKLLEAQLGGDKIRALERAAAWADTFLYVRALFEEAAKKFQEADQREAAQKKVAAERHAAVKLYQQLPLNEQFRAVRERFSERFGP